MIVPGGNQLLYLKNWESWVVQDEETKDNDMGENGGKWEVGF